MQHVKVSEGDGINTIRKLIDVAAFYHPTVCALQYNNLPGKDL